MYIDYKFQSTNSTLIDQQLIFNSGVSTTYVPIDPMDVVPKSYVDNLVSSISSTISTHISNSAIHLNSQEHNLLTSVTVTPNEINYLANVMSNIQTQLAGKISLTGGTLTGYLSSTATPVQNLEAVTKQYVDNKLSNYTTPNIQVGSILRGGFLSTPSGYLLCNGAAVDKTTYSVLYSIIGDTYNTTTNPGAGRPWCQQYGFNTSQSSDITGWTTGTPIPTNLVDFQAIVTKNRVYILGGYTGYNSNDYSYTAPINTDGTLGAWTSGAGLPSSLSDFQAIVTKNRVYILGGWYRTDVSYAVYTAPINTDGTLGTWTTGPSLPTPLRDFQAIATSSRVYLLGALGDSTVYSAPINTNGTLGAWTTGPSLLPATLGYTQAIVTKNRVYLLGAYIGRALCSAPINTDGTLGTWSIETSLPNIGDRPQAVVTNNRVYLLGGGNGGPTTCTAPINPDGTLGTWTNGTALPDVLSNSQVIVTSSRVYLLGGYGANGAASSTVYTAPFSGGLNDYSPYYNGTYTTPDPTKFKLPNYTPISNNYYIKY